jgi:catechol 2,3-dioxygenase-like lactoylglutathione lyase family enzyme
MSSIPSAHGVDHLAFTVPHLDEAVAFFCDALGAELVYELEPVQDPGGQWMRRQLGVHERAVAHIAMLRLGPVTNLELFEYRNAGEQAPPPRGGDWGSHYLGFSVADMEAAVRYLERLDGVRMLGEPVRVPDGPEAGSRFVYFQTPVGLLMKVQHVPAWMPYEGETGARRFAPCAEWHPAGKGIPTARNVDHLGLTVPHLPTAERFFCEYLGAELVHRLDPRWLDAGAMAELAVPAAGIVQLSLLRLGPTSNIELCQFEIPGQRQRPPANSDHGGHHVAFAVSDVDEAAGYLRSLRETEPLGTPHTEEQGAIAGTRWQYFRTSWGLHIEVVDMPPGVPLDRPATAARFEFGAAVPG